MAEPARKLEPKSQDSGRWQPRVITGGGEGGGSGERPRFQVLPGGGGANHNIETPAQEDAQKKARHLHAVPPLNESLDELENASAAANRKPTGETPIAKQEGFYTPKEQAKNQASEELKAAKARSAAYKAKGGKRKGIAIGLGAGGGLLSVVGGFLALLPGRLPAIMDTLVDDAGKRVEQVAERRAERIFIQFILRGSNAAIANGHVITTGNPIGDLFANMRTNKFEARLLSQHGLSFEPGPNGTVRLIHNSETLGDIRNEDDINRILNNNRSLSHADVRRIVRTQIPAWRFFKKAKFVRWISLKYNIPRFRTPERLRDESDEDYRKRVRQEHARRVNRANVENLNRLLECTGDDCPERRTGQQVQEELNESLDETIEEIGDETGDQESERQGRTLIQKALEKMIGKRAAQTAGASIPYVGIVILAADLQHAIGNLTSDNGKKLKDFHAEAIKRSSAVLGAAYAGYSDENKAGTNADLGIVGMFGDNFNGWEESASYSLINNGVVEGVQLDEMEKAGEAHDFPTWANFFMTAYNTTGWVARLPLEVWYQTVNRVLYAVADVGLDVIAWVMKFTPAAALLEAIAPHLAHIMATFMKFLGMYVDPLSVGARLALFVHQGFLGAFNDNAKESGMRKLSESQALAMDTEIRNERIADLAEKPLYDRLLNLDDHDSLATAFVAALPGNSTNPIGSLAGGSWRMVASSPDTLAKIATNRAMAAPAVTSESLFGLNKYGALNDDLNVQLHENVAAPTPMQCPENNDNTFNHCKYDRMLVEAALCSENPDCPDLQTAAAGQDEASAADTLPNDAKTLAAQILANNKITYMNPANNDPNNHSAQQDLKNVAAGKEANSRCGGTVPLDPMMLKVIIKAAEKYSFRINSMVSDHHCNQAMHPKGKGVDFGLVNGQTAINGSTKALYRQFSIDLSSWMTTGGRINQKQCVGDYTAQNNVKTDYLEDPCDHLHMNVP